MRRPSRVEPRCRAIPLKACKHGEAKQQVGDSLQGDSSAPDTATAEEGEASSRSQVCRSA